MKEANLFDYKIVIVTRSMNRELYQLSQSTIQLPFTRIRLENTSADGYFYELMKRDVDYIINIDEDVFVIDNHKLKELICYCIIYDIDICGFPDGGVLPIRTHNPLVVNPFFNIINIKKIKTGFSYQVVETYREHKKEYEKKTPLHLMRSPYIYDDYEPYYPFFIWLSQNYNVLYLDGETHPDGISTMLKDVHCAPFLIHTWYSRSYGKSEYHTNRIDRIKHEYNI